jgi:predicted amidohydrolase
VTPVLRVVAAQAPSLSAADLADPDRNPDGHTDHVVVNVARAVELVRAAADRGARLVVLPELFLTGYDPAAWSAATGVDPDDARLEPLQQVARERSVVVIAGAAVRRQRAAEVVCTIALVVCDATGALSVPYDKQHLVDVERPWFVPGEHGASIVVDGWELGLGVCYDGCFPEHARAAADDGADAYLCPAAYVVGSEHRRDLYYAARALDNGMYVVLAGLVGPCGDLVLSGGSAVHDPEGRPVARAGSERPALVLAELRAEEVARVREAHPLLRHRRGTLGTRERRELGAGGG